MRLKYLFIAAVLLAVSWAPSAKADDVLRNLTTHWLDYSSTAVATTNAFGPYVRTVDIVCTTNCYFAIALSGQALNAAARQSTADYLPADIPRRFRVSPNSKVVVIRVTADGRLNVTELSK